MLVSNIEQSDDGNVATLDDKAASFTTVNSAILTSIEIRFNHPGNNRALGQAAKVFTGNEVGTSLTLGTEVAVLDGPASIPAGIANYTYSAPAGTTLAASTTYYVLIEGEDYGLSVRGTDTGSAVDSDSVSGWGIPDDIFFRPRMSLGSLTREPGGGRIMIRVNGTLPNTEPTAANKTVETIAGTAYAFTAADFGFADADGDMLASVKIESLPTVGTLALDGTAVMLNDVVTRAQIDGGMLTFTPASDASGTGYASFTFKVNDGRDDSASAYTMTIDVSSCSTAPNLSGRNTVWSATLTGERLHISNPVVGDETYGYGFDRTLGLGALSDGDFAIDSTTYRVGLAMLYTDGDDDPSNDGRADHGLSLFIYSTGHLVFSLDRELSAAAKTNLRLHICDTAFNLDDATALQYDAEYDYYWSTALDWSSTTELGLYLSLPAGMGNAVAAATVEGPPVLSEADAGPWTPGDTVEVKLTFSREVVVGTTGGTPSIGLRLSGTQAQQALYVSGSGTTVLVFGYTLSAADGSHDSLVVPRDSLALNGGTIRDRLAGDAALAHDGVGKAALPAPPSATRAATRAVADGPTASFSDLPATHDGKKPFTVKLSFSAKPRGLSYKTVRDSLLEVTGGTVTGALRVTDGSDREWKVTVEPSQAYAITLTLPPRACSETAAVCVGGRPLARPASATIPGTPLTATLTGPAEHDGSESFEVRLTFSMEPHMSYKTVRDTMFTEKGGAITGARRVKPPHDREFDIVVKPGGDGAVSFSLASPLPACGETGAVCTAAGRKIEGTVNATIPGPVAISVADATVREGAGAALAFVVTLDRARSEAVTVDYATVPGSGAGAATEGSDYTATSGTLTFAPDDTEETVSVPVLVDAHDEGSETMTLTLTNPSPSDYVRIADGTATGTITNTGPMPGAWLARFGRTVGSQVLEAVSARVDGRPNSHLRVGGLSLGGNTLGGNTPLDAAAPLTPRDRLAAHLAQGPDARRPEERTLSGRELLLGSSFHLVSQAEAGSAPAFSAWGRVSTGGFQAEVDDLTMDGDVTTGLLGFDAEWKQLLAGLVLAHSEGDGGYNPSGGERGSIESSLNGIYPYARLRLNDRVLLWGLAGAGSGDLTLVWRDEAIDTGLGMRLGAIGVRGTLPAGRGFDLAVKSDALWVRTDSDAAAGLAAATAQVSRLRLILEARRTFALASGAVLAPTAQVGLRHDGGDAETGTGVEVGAGIRYTAGMLTLEGQVRTLLAHEAGGYEEWGASGAIRLSPDASGLGPSLALLPAWGASGSAMARLWSHPEASALVQGSTAAPAPGRLDAEFGWGLPALRGRGVLTPYARVALAEGDNQSWRLGARLALAKSLNLSLEGSRRRTGRDTVHDLTLRASMPW